MALPKIDTPIFEVILPLSQKHIKFRPFLVKEQKNLLMAIEADDKETIERNIKQILHNCTLTPDIEIERLPVVDIEYYFLQLRAKSVGEIVENTYICNNEVDGIVCGNKMEVKIDLMDIKVERSEQVSDVIELNNKISMKLNYPEFSTVERLASEEDSVSAAFRIIAESIDYIFDGDQYYYASDTSPSELMEFLESLNQEQFTKIERFFENLPKIRKDVEIKCSKCGYDHSISVEGLENFFG